MSDEENTFEVADAGASDCVPIRIGELKKGSHVVIKGHPCKIVDISTAKTGKHGSAKANFVGIDIFTDKKYEDIGPTSANTLAPIVTRSEMQLVDIDDSDVTDLGSIASCMNQETGEMVDDLRVPDDAEYKPMRETLAADEKDLFVIILEAMGQRKILPNFTTKDRK